MINTAILKKYILLLLLIILSPTSVLSNTLEECDKLIREGVLAMNKKEHFKSLELLTEARIMAENNNWTKQRFLAINNIANNYYLMLDYGEALDTYLEAYKIAIKELDVTSEMIVLNNIAILYSKEKKYEKADEYFNKAYSIANEKQDSVKIGLYAVNLAVVSNEQNKLKLAEEYLNIAFPLIQNQPIVLKQAQVAKAENLLLSNKLDDAEKLSFHILPALNDNEYKELRIAILLIISRIYEQKGDIAKATSYALQALKVNYHLESRIAIYQRLSELYKKDNHINLAFEYRDLADIAKDSLVHIKNGVLFENSRIKFELQNYQNELSISESKRKTEHRIFFVIVAFGIISISLVIWILKTNTTKYKQRKTIAERNQKIIELELQKEKDNKILLEKQYQEKETLALLEQEKLKNEIETKNRELVSNALRLTNRNELIEYILNSLSAIPEISKDTSLVSNIRKLKNNLKENDVEWQNFLTHFEEVNSGFLLALKSKHPDLSANDIRFIAYIYMNLNTKEISSLLNITQDACRKRKERVCRKMQLPDNVDLYNYLSTI